MNLFVRGIVGCLAATILLSAAHAQPAWQLSSIGGASSTNHGASTVVSIGDYSRDIWDRSDSFTFYRQPWTGDGELVARVTVQGNSDPWAKAAVMFRETLSADSRHAMMCVTPGNGTAFQYRTTTGGDSASSAPTGFATLPVWLKIVRSGTTLTGFTSTNGTTWTQAGTVSLSGLASSIYVGLAVTSHTFNWQGNASFENISLTGPSTSSPGAPVITTRPPESVGSGYPYTYQIVASNSPTRYSVEGLPAGLTLDPNTGRIWGVTGNNGGSYTVTLRATNASGTGSATQTMVVSGSGPIEMPWIESVTPPAAGTYRVGDTLIFLVRAHSYYGPLHVTGQPRFAFTLGSNTRFATYAWGSGATANGTGDNTHAYSYTVTAADVGATGIVTSETIDVNGGTIQDPWPLWCPLNMRSVSAPGVQCVSGSTSPTAAPVISTPERASAVFDRPFSFQITASGAPTSYSMSLAPSPTRPLGVTLDPATGKISGTIQASGTYTLTLRATNSIGTGTKTLTVVVPHIITNITLPAAGTYRAGSTLNVRLTFSNPMRVTGTPSIGFTLGDRQRQFTYASGSDREHTFSYTVQAGDVDLDNWIQLAPIISLNGGSIQDAESGVAYGTALPRNLAIRDVIVDAPGAAAPVITSPDTASGTVGAAFNYRITVADPSVPTTYNAGQLPAGLSVNTSTGVISGTPTTSGATVISVSATTTGGTANKAVHVSIAAGSDGAWQSRDIGAVAAAGSSQQSGGTVTIRASGADIWENADEFHFRYQVLNGDGEIVARVAGLQNTHPWAKAGVMFRESLEPGALHAFGCVSQGFGTALQYRSVRNGQTATTNPSGTTHLPTWLKLVRRNNGFNFFVSQDGTNWTEVAGLGLTHMAYGGPLYVGLAVTSHNDGVVNTATFDQVSVTTPTPPSGPPPTPSLSAYAASAREVNLSWSDGSFTETGFELERATDGTNFTRIAALGANVTTYLDTNVSASSPYHYRIRALNSSGYSPYSAIRSVTTPAATTAPTWNFGDIGTVGTPGSNSSGTNTITISGAGADIWDNADSFRFVYRAMHGNVVVEAQVTSMGHTHAWAKAGVMIRQSLAPDARNVFAFVTPNLVAAQARTSTGSSTVINTGPWTSAPTWVRLVRNGTRITAYTGSNGTAWTEIAGYDVAMAEPVYVGFAVTSHDPAQLNTAVFTDPFVE